MVHEAEYHDVRPIIVAEHASARFGGEAILPLHYFRLLRKRGIETWLVVHERTRRELDAVLGSDRDRVSYVPDVWLQKACCHLGTLLPDRVANTTFGLVTHAVTQSQERRIVRALVNRVDATVVHEPIPVSPRQPSMMYDVGAPVIIGPMNGGMSYPPGLRHVEGRLERAYVSLARHAAAVANAVVPGKRKAFALLVANRRTRQALPRGTCPNIVELVENGVDVSLFCPPDEARLANSRTRFAFVGRLVEWKGVDLLLNAMSKARCEIDLELHVVGDGPERNRLETLAAKLCVADRIVFHGLVPQATCATLLANTDALVLPSLYESGGAVVLEAMAMGLPVVATRWGGPADYLDETTGILVEPIDRQRFVNALALALVRLARSPELRARLGAAARQRVAEHFAWERKIDRIIEVYRQARCAGPPGASKGTCS
jgi:glycosyltransferase involved in cell wall biosynthesis